MSLRKCAAFFSPPHLCACFALLTTSAALHFFVTSPSSFSSFSLMPAINSSIAAAGNIAAIATTTADHVGATAAVCSSLLYGRGESFPRIRPAAVSFSSLKAAATTAATAVAAHQLVSQPLLAVAQSSVKTAGEEASEPFSGDETLLTWIFSQLRNVEIPTVSAAVSSGVDRLASAVLLHFFPEAQLAHEAPPSPGSLPSRKEASSSPPSTAGGSAAAAERTGVATDGVALTRRGSATAITERDVKTQITAPAPTAVLPSAEATAAAPVRGHPGDWCVPRNSGSTCSSIPPGSAGGGDEILSFSPLSAPEDIALSSFSSSYSSSHSSLSSYFSLSSRDAAQGQRVCQEAARQQGACSFPTSEAAPKQLSNSQRTAPAGEKQEEFSSRLAGAAREGKPEYYAGAAATLEGEEQSQARLHLAGGAGGRGRTEANSALLSSVPTAGAGEDQSDTALPSAATAPGTQRSGFALPSAGEKALPFGELEFAESFFEGLRNAKFPPASSFSVDVADVRTFLSSLDFFDPLLLVLLGFHVLLVAGTVCCRRMHALQLLLMSVVSVLLLCSKQLLLLCSLVEQRLRTDDSLASAVASFSSPPPSSSPSSAVPQFYCSPSAAARATLFLLLFWWLPLFTALSLLVGALVQELVASVRLLATRKAEATKRRSRSRYEAAAAAAVPRPPPAAASGGDNAAIM